MNKKERYIKFSLELRIFHLNEVKECIVIYNHKCLYDMQWCSVRFSSRVTGLIQVAGVRTKSNNKTWRVVFR